MTATVQVSATGVSRKGDGMGELQPAARALRASGGKSDLLRRRHGAARELRPSGEGRGSPIAAAQTGVPRPRCCRRLRRGGRKRGACCRCRRRRRWSTARKTRRSAWKGDGESKGVNFFYIHFFEITMFFLYTSSTHLPVQRARGRHAASDAWDDPRDSAIGPSATRKTMRRASTRRAPDGRGISLR